MPTPTRRGVRAGTAPRRRAYALVVSAGVIAVAAALAGCAKPAGTSGAGSLGGVPASSTAGGATSPPAATHTTPPATPATHASTPPPVPALTCGQLRSAAVGSTTVSYNGYHDGIPLGGLGVWSGEDGNTVTLQPQCGIGDLDGDGARDAVGVVALTSGGSGDFYTLVVWHNDHGNPVCVAVADFPDGNDRTPVQSIAIAHRIATVVYLTRTADAPMIQLNIKRTATYTLSVGHFTETGHTDQPYSG